jgi:hypothetical protein
MSHKYSPRLLYEVESKGDNGKPKTSHYLLRRTVHKGLFSSSITGRLWQECSPDGTPTSEHGLPNVICYSPKDAANIAAQLKNGGISDEEMKKSSSQNTVDYEETAGYLIRLVRRDNRRTIVSIGLVKKVTDLTSL